MSFDPQTSFDKLSRVFGVVSLLLLITLAIVPIKDHFSEWHQYQKSYQKLIRGRTDTAILERHFQPGIQQTWIPEQGVVDRCATCHVALKEASLQGAAQPFRPHPPIPHSLTQFGCVVCHRGQGPATSVEEAHSSTKAWEQPILPAKYLEAGCGQCHLAPLEGTPHLNQGRALLASYGCVHCHATKQPDGTVMLGSDDPPPLVHIAEKTSREWIYVWLKDPHAFSARATMPNFELSDSDASDISAFLISQSTPVAQSSSVAALTGAQTKPSDAEAGASLYGESFCASCHSVQNAAGNLVGGDIGPELTRIGSKVKPGWLRAWLQNPNDYEPATRMPHFRFTPQQIAILAGFLEAKTDSDLLANVHLAEAKPEQIAHGKALVVELGCAACHDINGVPKPDNLAPDLSRIGSKMLAQIVFAPGVAHTLPDYISAKIANPRAFGPGLKMPQFSLTPQQMDLLTTALLALTDRAQTQVPSLRTASVQDSGYQPAGSAGKLMNDLRCLTCHRVNGRGGDLAPDLSWEGSAVERKWLSDFLKNPGTLRPALIRRMPRFNLSDQEIATLTDYIMTVYQDPAIDRDSLPAGLNAPDSIEKGRQLFYSKYACQSCHIVDFNKDKGYIGPSLAAVGARLTPAWTYAWLKNPQALRPGTMEPNQQISDADARSLTAFLMSLKAVNKTEAQK
jgi:mono/diheme cytochrome c family protein